MNVEKIFEISMLLFFVFLIFLGGLTLFLYFYEDKRKSAVQKTENSEADNQEPNIAPVINCPANAPAPPVYPVTLSYPAVQLQSEFEEIFEKVTASRYSFVHSSLVTEQAESSFCIFSALKHNSEPLHPNELVSFRKHLNKLISKEMQLHARSLSLILDERERNNYFFSHQYLCTQGFFVNNVTQTEDCFLFEVRPLCIPANQQIFNSLGI